jgi:heptosyltransferase II
MSDYKNILVVRTDRIGDVILTTPALKALREKFRHSRITLLVTPQTQSLVDKNPYIDEVLVDDRKNQHQGIMGFWKLVGEIRQKRYDLAIIYHTKRRTNYLCGFAGIPIRLGYRDHNGGFLLTHQLKDERPSGKKHEADYCLDLLRPLGIVATERELHVSLHVEDERWAEEQIRKMGISGGITHADQLIAVHLGASDPSKQWPIEYFAELMERMREKYSVRFVLVGAASLSQESKKLQELTKMLLWDMTGQTSLSQLASLLARCRLLISNDSGPVHVAAAVNTPVVSIFTRNQPGINPERWAPLEPRSRAVSVAFDPAPAFRKSGVASQEYLHKLKPVQVLEAVDAVFKLC